MEEKVYDALRSDRPYKRGFSHEESIDIITKGDGRVEPSHFDPEILSIFLSLSDSIKDLYENVDNYPVLA